METIEDRINSVNTIEAVSRIKISYMLEFIGHCNSLGYFKSVANLVKIKDFEHNIFFRGNADEPTLHKYYLNSTVFLQVSRLQKASSLMDKETFIENSQSLFNTLKQEGK